MLNELGLTQLGDAGIAVAVLITVIFVAWSGKAVALAWLASIRENNAREHEREMQRIKDQHAQEMAEKDANRAIADALTALKKRLETDAQRQDLLEATTRNLITSSKQLSELLAGATERMTDRSKVVDNAMAAIHQDVKTVPLEVWRLGDPKLAGVIQALAAMEERLLARIQPTAEVARGVIKDEFGELMARVQVLADYIEGHTTVETPGNGKTDSASAAASGPAVEPEKATTE